MTGHEVHDDVREHDEAHVDDEDGRLRSGLGRLELARVQEIVRRNLPTGPHRVLDVGGATGVHAEWLLADGHTVHMVDPGGWLRHLAPDWDEPGRREVIVEAARVIEAEPSLAGLSPHLIAVAHRGPEGAPHDAR